MGKGLKCIDLRFRKIPTRNSYVDVVYIISYLEQRREVSARAARGFDCSAECDKVMNIVLERERRTGDTRDRVRDAHTQVAAGHNVALAATSKCFPVN